MRVVLDTSVLVAALRSPQGASGFLVEQVLQGKLKPLVSVPLALEYEVVLTRPEHLLTSGASSEQVVNLVKAFCRKGEPVHTGPRLRPQLMDPDDEFILETAVYGRAEAIVSFNWRHFVIAARRFKMETIAPSVAAERFKRV